MTEGSIHTGSEPGDQERHEHTSTNNEIHTPSRANFLNPLACLKVIIMPPKVLDIVYILCYETPR